MSKNPDRNIKKIIVIMISAVLIIGIGAGVVHYTSIPKEGNTVVEQYNPQYDTDNEFTDTIISENTLPDIAEIIEETEDGQVVYETEDGEIGAFDKAGNLERAYQDGDPNEMTIEEIDAAFEKDSEDFLKQLAEREQGGQQVQPQEEKQPEVNQGQTQQDYNVPDSVPDKFKQAPTIIDASQLTIDPAASDDGVEFH